MIVERLRQHHQVSVGYCKYYVSATVKTQDGKSSGDTLLKGQLVPPHSALVAFTCGVDEKIRRVNLSPLVNQSGQGIRGA